jgi:hypothetical protein
MASTLGAPNIFPTGWRSGERGMAKKTSAEKRARDESYIHAVEHIVGHYLIQKQKERLLDLKRDMQNGVEIKPESYNMNQTPHGYVES